MVILGIETSCDETAAAVLEQKNHGVQILSNVVASSASIQEKYGGIIPEQAAREQIKAIIPVIEEALIAAGLSRHPELVSGSQGIPKQVRNDVPNIDAIAVTYGPGLMGSLLVGVETAKTLAIIWNKPLIPINHLLGHFYANWINQNQESRIKNQGKNNHDSSFMIQTPSFPCIGLLVSGGHTDLVLFTDHGKYKYLGGTRDDAAGECFDKCARLLGLPYPGGPAIAQSAMEFKIQNSKFKIELPRPLLKDKSFDFSFSGLKTAAAREVEKLKSKKRLNQEAILHLSYEIQEAITGVLIDKTVKAAQKYKVDQIMVAGGVASNQRLISELKLKIENLKLEIKVAVPPPSLCTDNGAMIASAAFFADPIKSPVNLQADPNLSLA